MAILQLLAALLVYLVAVVWTLALPVVLTAPLLGYSRTRRRRGSFLVTLLVGAGYLAGGAAGWRLRPARWEMAFGETFKAAFNAEKYGHALESQAERVLLYPLYMAVLCSIAAAVAAWFILRVLPRATAEGSAGYRA